MSRESEQEPGWEARQLANGVTHFPRPQGWVLAILALNLHCSFETHWESGRLLGRWGGEGILKREWEGEENLKERGERRGNKRLRGRGSPEGSLSCTRRRGWILTAPAVTTRRQYIYTMKQITWTHWCSSWRLVSTTVCVIHEWVPWLFW